MPVKDWKEGMKMQGKFYAFRGAMSREADKLLNAPESAWKDRVTLGLRHAREVVCWLDRSREPCVRFGHRENTPEALMLQEMLDGAGVKTQEQILAESAERLAKDLLTGGKYG
jgi:hypothetical protein